MIDTNVVIDYLGQKLPVSAMKFLNEVIDSIPNVSIISRIEILGFSTSEENYQLLVNFMNDAIVLDLTEDVANQSIEIRKKLKTTRCHNSSNCYCIRTYFNNEKH